MGTGTIIIVIGLLTAIIIVAIIISKGKKDKWVSTDDFNVAKNKLGPHSTSEEVQEFMNFLGTYKGGYVRRRSGQIVYQDYLGKEKGDLKGIFFNNIVPNPNLSIFEKEAYRNLIISKGVKGVEERPSYETRDSKLKNREKDENDYKRKEVGNKGEQAVRDVLYSLNQNEYSVINGPMLKYNDVTKEYDHIVVSNRGIFIIETKAFGMTDGVPDKARLFIDEGDKWIINKHGNNRDLVSPTPQLEEEKQQIVNILSMPFDIKLVLALSNSEISVKQNINLPYDVIRIDELRQFIEDSNDRMFVGDKNYVLGAIDKSRVN